MDRLQIEKAIQNSRKGIGQYLEIMKMFNQVDVSQEPIFQKKYNAFYRVRQRNANWYDKYYSLMEFYKGQNPSFGDVLDKINELLNRYEPSFSSKLLATLNPNNPVWDIHILNNTGHKAPLYTSKKKIHEAKIAYESIVSWYGEYLQSSEGQLCLDVFNDLVPEHDRITDIKKVDFILWQKRG